MKEQHCTMFVVNNGDNFDVIMGLTSYLNQGTLLKAVSSGTLGCRKLTVNGRYYSKEACSVFQPFISIVKGHRVI